LHETWLVLFDWRAPEFWFASWFASLHLNAWWHWHHWDFHWDFNDFGVEPHVTQNEDEHNNG
jgi:hypothetical protein